MVFAWVTVGLVIMELLASFVPSHCFAPSKVGYAVRYVTVMNEQGRRDACRLIAINVCSFGLLKPNANANPPKKSLPEEYRQGTMTLSEAEESAPIPREAYKTLPSGVIYADLTEGVGEVVGQGSRINMQWVLRKSNGYFVDSSAVQNDVPFIFTVGSTAAISGVDEGIRGMKVGGSRRLLIPPRLAYVDGLEDGKPGPLPAGFGPRQQMRRVQNARKDVPGEYLYLEVKVTRVRN